MRRRSVALAITVALVTPVALTTLASPAAASVPGTPGTPVAVGMQNAAAVRWTAPSNPGSPPLTGYRVEANDGTGWVPAAVHHGADGLVAGAHHTCALLDSGQVKCWGRNGNGELGQGNTANRGDGPGEMSNNLPAIALGTGRTATAVSAGNDHTCALLDNAAVKCWGANGVGQLGQGDTTNRGDNSGEMGDNLPAIDLGTGRTATAITAGPDYTCALLDNASVKCWGDNGLGQLGLGDTTSRGDNPNEMGDNLPAVDLGTGRSAIAIATGSAHTCALLDNGTVKCWGYNFFGQLGQGDTTQRGDAAGEMGDNLPAINLGTGRTATAISAGDDNTCALLDNASVKCWGRNGNGELGQGDTARRGDDPNEMGNNLPAIDLGTGRTATAITSGSAHNCAVLDNGSLKCWGYNGFGQLGQGDIMQRGDGTNEMGNNLPATNLGTGRTATAITADSNNTCALLDNAALKCWGNNDYGQLGQGDVTTRGDNPNGMGDNLQPVALASSTTATAIANGGFGGFTCAVITGGSLKCWGDNTFGNLGLGDTTNRGDNANEMGSNLPAVSLGSGRTAVNIAAGDTAACALLDNGTVKCWGRNAVGELGQGDTTDRGDNPGEMGNNLPAVDLGTGRTATAITEGSNFACALLDNATVKCWGSNSQGELGQGDTTARGDNPGEMGDNLPAINLGTGRTATAISAAGTHACAVLDNGTLKCWGDNFFGKLGLGDTTKRGDQPNQMGDNLPAVDLGTGRTATAVAAGIDYTCALLDNASVKCWGYGGLGRLGYGDTANRGGAAGQMGDNLPTVDLGTGRTATAIAAGSADVCVVLDNAGVKCWGYNGSGQLGLGDTAARGDNAGEMGDNLPTVDLGTGRTATAIAAGSNSHSCALLDNGTVKCWGSNFGGQLGQGDQVARGNNAGEMGDNLQEVALTDPAGSAPATSAIARLAPGTYQFRVVALNSAGESTPSGASSSVTVTGVPGVPTAVVATGANGQISLSWTAPASDGGHAITDYAVNVYSSSGGTATGVTGATARFVGSATTNYAFAGLTNGTAYTFKVAAVNVAGTGSQSSLSAPAFPATFTVPATAADPNGHDTGMAIDNSVTLTATGTWCYANLQCYGPAGNSPPNPGGAGFLEPTATIGALVGRLGTSGSWTEIGAGPETLTGTGELYLAINDQTGGYGDNSGSLQVSVAANLHFTTSYAQTPILAGTKVGWFGQVTNNGTNSLTNVKLFASAAVGLATANTDTPAWHFVGSNVATPCTLTTPGTTAYYCTVPAIAPAQSVEVDANALTQGLAPQTLTSNITVGISDQTGGCFGFCPVNVPNGPGAEAVVDGLQFHITAPATVTAGSTLTISGYVANTSASDGVAKIATFSTIDKGHITAASNCGYQNAAPTGATDRCPASGTFDLPAGTDTSAFPASIDIDTTGLAGQTIHYAAVGTSPDIGGNSEVATGSVFVTAPAGGIAISSPANGATLAGSVANDFTAVPSPTGGDNVTSVDFSVDEGTPVNVAAPGPYTRTFGANSLAPGPHTLTALMHQDGGGADASTSVTVHVAAAPAVTIVPPSGFSSGGSLTASKTFTATVTPSAPATVASVAWLIDNTTPVPSASTSPYAATVNPAILVLSAGAHTLTATATDSLGQTTTDTFNFTVPQATLTTPTVTPLADSVTPGGDAAWTVTINNSSSSVARHMSLTLNATATDATSAVEPLTFDTSAINGALHVAPATPTCQTGAAGSLVCTLSDLPALSGVQFPVFVRTDNTTDGSIVVGDTVASAANAPTTNAATLDQVDINTCGSICVEGVVAAGTAFDSDPDHTATTEQIANLSKGLQSTAHGVKFGKPFRLGIVGLRNARVTFKPRLDTNPSIKIRLSSIDPLASTDPIDASLCPTSTTCKGEISEVSGIFTPYTNKADPIVAVVIAKWGTTVPSGGMWMQKPDTGSGIPSPIQLHACVVNSITRQFNTPCVLPEIVKSLTVNNVTNMTTYDTILFTGNDPHFARR